MAFHYRRLLAPKKDPCNRPGPRPRSDNCALPDSDLIPPSRPPPPPPLPLVSGQANQQVHHMSPILILMLCILGVAFLLVGYFLLVMKYYSDLNNSTRWNSPIFEEDTHETEDFFDENQGPVLDHPIWYINTLGLQQTVIDSIALFKYKRDDGLIEGTECSVCLNEFQEDESLRLLPKCSHAFHTPCIDTWLRSHTNCPLCRAPVVSDPNHAHVSIVEPNSSDLGTREEDAPVESLENYGGLGSHGVGEDGTSEIRDESSVALPIEDGLIAETLEKDLQQFNAKYCGVRVLSDLADHRPNVEEQLQPVRRSVSMDSSSAAMIYRAMANIPPVEHEGCSDTMSVQVKKPNSEKAAKRVNRSSSIYRLNSSFGRSIQKGRVSMKRSFSSGRKFSLSRSSRSQDSILSL